jgi:pimeloyl-ACP methyl ester carboxylesterase
MRKVVGLEYQEHGRGEPLLLIHGAFIADALSRVAREPSLTRSHRVIWYRRRGYGGSDPVSPPFSIAQQADDARDLLAGLGIERADVLGHSGGGVIATELALRAPGLVRSLVVLEPAIFPPALVEAFTGMLAPVLAAYGSGDVQGSVDAFMKLVGPEREWDWRAELAAALPGAPEQADRDAPVTFDIDLPQIATWRFDADRARDLACPVLYVQGSESGPLYETLQDHFLSLVPKAEPIELRGVDHSMPMQNPGLVADLVARFLARTA